MSRPDPASLAAAARRRGRTRPPESVGRGQGNPDFAARPPLPLAEVPPPASVAAMVNGHNAYLRTYRLGECSVVVTRERGRWHVSVAHPGRYPGWDEIAEARYRVVPDGVVMAMVLPPKANYVNIHKNCFQLLEIVDPHHGDFSGGEPR